MIKSFNNRTEKAGDDLKSIIRKGSKIDIAAGIFSIYGYESLKNELSRIEKLRFIFTDPTFIETDKEKRELRQFQINSILRQKAIGGTQFEINLKNELKGKSIAKECKKWIEQKVEFRSNIGHKYIQPHLNISHEQNRYVYTGINEFSSAGIGYEKDNSILNHIIKTDDFEITRQYFQNFEEIWNDRELLKDVTDEVTGYIADLYKENSPEFIYYFILYNIFDEFLEDITEDELANEKTGFKQSVIWNKLYDFQKDAVLGVINKLERYNGCILADSVGLGKTFTALGVIKYYQERNRSTLVLCPKKLGDNWQTFLNNYDDNSLVKDRFNYDVLYHTDLLRERGLSNGIDLSRINWGNYDLVVIDESHNFRNNDPRKDRETRYHRLMNKVMRAGVKTKVLMLSATPVNNRFTDLKNQLALAFEGHTGEVDDKMDIGKSVDIVLKNAQTVFNEWMRQPEEDRTSTRLLQKLNTNFDFFKLLDSVTIARSRRHIERYYNMNEIGKFPNRLKPVTHRANITDLEEFIKISDLYNELTRLNMSVYSPFDYILDGKKRFYGDIYDTSISDKVSFKQLHRERNLQTLMRVNLLKRLESSVDSFRITLNKFITGISNTISRIEDFEVNGSADYTEIEDINDLNLDSESDDWLNDEFSIGDKIKINLEDMNTSGWKTDLRADLEIAENILQEMERVTPDHDSKLNDLKEKVAYKIQNPINEGNKKILIFSAFADTVNYLYENLADYLKKEYRLETAKITGSDQNKSTLNIHNGFNNILINFSPRSKERRDNTAPEIDILIATDCISEGQNLQDCDTLINYDIHWNPVRIIQRFGRIDRIGSINNDIQLINFWPQLSLDDYINLKNRVETKMHMVDVTATGEDNVLTNKSSDLMFRKKQLEKLQEEIVDLEDMGSGVSITDLGLNDFRMDLVNYINENGDLEKVSNGIHTVCKKDVERGIESGVIFVLKNINPEVNIDNTNQLHPFYLVYVNEKGGLISNHLNVKSTLDILRKISKGEKAPIREVYELFNNETNDGKNMGKYSDLLGKSIESILNVKDESDVESLFSPGGTSALLNNIRGLEDFELITFVAVK
ncbi:MAG: DEAD/DEAH box helicase family protein [Ignavibacteriales bacterium]|nr:DEAD/DEAH box helicase family protein [Ignavibacteriales bacterium]MCF8316459.1 DEAD/DEAH box helicase family protein [Ignavibacteriales bacterium]MCF8437939.1 DEAD/DEAH box helicase family protein [Ignavibacteriales bacterium]